MSEAYERRIRRAENILLEAGDAGAKIVETTPKLGGLRAKDVLPLIQRGRAEWIEPFVRARLVPTPHQS